VRETLGQSDHAKFMAAQKVAEKYMAKWRATKAVLAVRERELLELKGQCSTCRLHYAHSGPCDAFASRNAAEGGRIGA
jgi:hypothetical protein